MRALKALLSGIIDYAGLFPPAGLDLPAALLAFAAYRRSRAAWMLGRFVVPASRLDDLVRSAPAAGIEARADAPLRLAVTGGEDAARDLDTIRRVTSLNPAIVVDTYERRVSSPAEVARLSARAGASLRLACEVPVAGRPLHDGDVAGLLEAIRAAGGVAKIRTGGLTPDAIPGVDAVAAFLWGCSLAGVPMKATAGLHHPVRGPHNLTDAADGPVAVTHGFLNVFVAAVLAPDLRARAQSGATPEALADVLQEEDPAAFAFDNAGLTWRHERVSVEAIAARRAGVALAFGSCSFAEPVEDLRALGHAV